MLLGGKNESAWGCAAAGVASFLGSFASLWCCSALCRPHRRAGAEILPRAWRVGAGRVCASWGPVCWWCHPQRVGPPGASPLVWGLQAPGLPGSAPSLLLLVLPHAAELERGRSSCWQPSLRPTCVKCLSQSRTTLLQSFRFLEGWFLREKKKKRKKKDCGEGRHLSTSTSTPSWSAVGELWVMMQLAALLGLVSCNVLDVLCMFCLCLCNLPGPLRRARGWLLKKPRRRLR